VRAVAMLVGIGQTRTLSLQSLNPCLNVICLTSLAFTDRMSARQEDLCVRIPVRELGLASLSSPL
jgi:hypothetical protein